MKKERKGRLIVIEGVDGSGKETQTKALYERLKADGEDIIKISYPRYDKESSALVKMYLRGDFGSDPEAISPYIASTFYAVDRYASYKEDYEEFYKEGGMVLVDRYTTSNMVHQASKIMDAQERERFLEWLWNYEFQLYGLPVPDLVFFLDIPMEINQGLREGRLNKSTGEEEQDIHELDGEYLKKSYENALTLVDRYGWQRISCLREGRLRTIEDIHGEIYKKVRKFLAR